MADNQTVAVTLVKSRIGRLKAHLGTLDGLGLKRMHQTVTVVTTPEIRGMLRSVAFMVKVREI